MRGFGIIYFKNGQVAFIDKIQTPDPIIWTGKHFLKGGKIKIMNNILRNR